jgi:hypothetical protein
LSKENYVLGNTLSASKNINSSDEKVLAYAMLHASKIRFIAELSEFIVITDKNEIIMDKDVDTALSHSLYTEMYNAAVKVNEYDVFLKRKWFQFLPNLGSASPEMRNVIFKEFRDCFTNITTQRKSYQGKKEQYFRIDGQLERTLLPELVGFKFT